jgi:hypothetical protein
MFLRVARKIRPVPQKMHSRHPNAIRQSQKQTVQKTPTSALASNHVGGKDKNREPAKRLNAERDKVHRGHSHEQAKQGELKNQFPVQGSTTFLVCAHLGARSRSIEECLSGSETLYTRDRWGAIPAPTFDDLNRAMR